MPWDEQKLDALLIEIETSVRQGLRAEEQHEIPEEQGSARVVGYWMYRLLECKPGAVLTGGPTVDGPLFDEGRDAQ